MLKTILVGVALAGIIAAAPAFAQTATPEAVKAINHAITPHKHTRRDKRAKTTKMYNSAKTPAKHETKAPDEK